MAYRLGVDVGGTFTDLFLVDDVAQVGRADVGRLADPGDAGEDAL
jgi:N-methylhydantoinase A/oxoprolinase/acetone carboxylase beta subunit